MSDDEARVPDEDAHVPDEDAHVPAEDACIPAEEPAEPILLPEDSWASPGSPAVSWRGVSPGEPVALARPRVWTVWVVLVASLVVTVVGAVALVMTLPVWEHAAGSVFSAQAEEAVPGAGVSLVGLLSTMSWTMVVFFGAAVAAAALSPVPWRERLRLRPARISAFGILVHVGGVLAIGFVLGALLSLGVLPESPKLADLTEIVTGLSGARLLATVLVIGIAPGIAEEFLFRGYVQTRFSQRWGPGWGVLWTALLFGLMHLDLIQGTFAFALGVYLGYLTEWTGSTWPAVICHAANNTYSTLATAWGLDVEGAPANVVALLVGLLILVLAVWHLRAHVKPNGRDTSCALHSREPGTVDQHRRSDRR